MAEKNKLPALQFYPGDWRKDPGVQSLDWADRAVWFEIILIMHESPRRGVLLLPNGKPMTAPELSRNIGMPVRQLAKALARIDAAGVSSIEEGTEALINRRMVRDEKDRKVRAEGGPLGAEHGAKGAEFGKFGGRPRKTPLTTDEKTPLTEETKPPSKRPPSSSSSSSDIKPPKSPAIPDPAFDLFADAHKVAKKTAYVSSKGDFVKLAELRKANNLNGKETPEGWETAVSNYFASPVSKVSLAHLCEYFATFLNSPTDRYGKPTRQEAATTNRPRGVVL